MAHEVSEAKSGGQYTGGLEWAHNKINNFEG